MEQITGHGSKFYRIYMAVMLTLTVVLLAALLGFMVYGALRVQKASQNVSKKIDAFNSQVKTINHNLQGIQTLNQGIQNVNTSLQELNKQLQTTPTSTSLSSLSSYKVP